ncbi:ferredoxin [Candidatus Latescibacterota bacterium]
MSKIKPEDLDRICERVRRTTFLREGAGIAKITIHMETCGISVGAREIMSTLLTEIEKRDIKDVLLAASGCAGLCSKEPMATVELKGEPPVKYIDLTQEKIIRILNEHVLGGNIVKEYALAIGSERVY